MDYIYIYIYIYISARCSAAAPKVCASLGAPRDLEIERAGTRARRLAEPG